MSEYIVDELASEDCDRLQAQIDVLTAERDEWKAKCETREFAYKQADAERKRLSEQIDGLFAERDEWKAKAEGQSKVIVGSSKSAKRAAAVERLKANKPHTYMSLVRDAVKDYEGMCDADAFIDLLSDDGANDDLPPEAGVSAADADANDANAVQDTREKLEADVYRAADEMDALYNGERFINTHKIIGWLDRHAAITEREVEHDLMKSGRMAVEVERERIKKLTAERDNLKANNQQLHTLAGEQAAKIDELQSAFDAICANLSIIVKGEPNVIADIAIETIEELIDECNTAYRQCNEYRNKFGKCLDYADAIHALMDDEGMA